MNEEDPVKLRPDGKLELNGAAEDVGAALLALVKDAAAGKDAAVAWVRNLVAEHVRRIVAASEDGGIPSEAVRERCRPDAMARLAILSSVPPMVGGEYWNDDVLVSLYADVERAPEGRVRAAGGDLLAFVQTFGSGWRDLGKVSLHLAENKGDKSGSRPFAFLATFVNRADADGKMRHLPLSAALKAYAARPAALKPLLARRFEAEMFEPPAGHRCETYAHLMERMLGFSVTAAGMRIAAFNGSLAWRRRYYGRDPFGKLCRFLFQVKHDSNKGVATTKILHVPVWKARKET